ncbi:MAG: PKD domain-containing protein [Bacteroidetes bacterium]|jgi:PKD repeat protein|nr:PKD domain-containing protein [Bacteroidota bacterium]MBT6687224.1 PKD domain-containing protein [Bacteroidota bacterium]MBT7144589.1 PKD domain-containing protein [Bacteroidota bacterium]MBT7490789.1 PKD domain-containing protein [Bacteroidota bacterium]
MKNLKLLLLIGIAAFFLFPLKGNTQISQGGTPWSMYFDVDDYNYPTKIFPKLNMTEINKEDEGDLKNGIFYKIGRSIPINLDINNSGKWTKLPDGKMIWRLKIKSEDAKALVVYYNDFYLPPGGKLYLYNEDQSQIIGAFTEFNNPESGNFATEIIQGETVTLEYNEEKNPRGKVRISISEISYIYRGVSFPQDNVQKGFGDSDNCQVNVNCSPEGNDWGDQSRGVVRIMLTSSSGQGWCSGSLINTEEDDCTPYVLTADHCGGGATQQQYDQWIFYFNYEAPDCANPSAQGNLESQSITGCTLTSRGGNGGTAGSDFHLVLLNQEVPELYEPYFNGWDRENIAASSGVSIHHPSGDIKKISTFGSTLTTSDWNGSGVDSHWRVTWDATTNGHGVTEGGSSGSPIFNSNGLIVGDLTGGSSYCTATGSPDLYGKLSYSWDQNGSAATERLKDWLDPNNTGVLTVDGRDYCYGNEANAQFTSSLIVVVEGGTIDYTDLSTGSPTSWSWVFEGGIPGTSNSQNPTGIIYDTAGTYNVSLTITNATGSDIETKQINVVPPGPPIADFVATTTVISVGDNVDFLDLTTGGPDTWTWTFQGGYPTSSTDQNPSDIYYYNTGTYSVSLTAENPYGIDFITKNAYITVNPEIPIVASCDTLSNIEGFDSLMTQEVNVGGVIPGQNGYNITEYADLFINPILSDTMGIVYEYTQISALKVPVEISTSTINNSKIRFKIWDVDSIPGYDTLPGPDVVPTTVLGQQDVFIYEMTPNFEHIIEFSQPVELSGDFCIGYQVFYVEGDYFAASMAADRGMNGNSTLYVNFDSQWLPITHIQDTYIDSGMTSSLAIKPIVCKSLNIEYEPLPESEILVYPNPSYDYVNINLVNINSKKSSIQIFDILGNRINILNNKISDTHFTIDFRNQANGIYFINFIAENKIFTKKVSIIK